MRAVAAYPKARARGVVLQLTAHPDAPSHRSWPQIPDGGLLTIDASEDEALTGITLTFPESLGLHSTGAASQVRLSYEVPGSSWSAFGDAQGVASVNVTALTADGIVGTFTGEVVADGNQARRMVTISQGAFDIRF